MTRALADVIRKVEGWEGNLRANAEHIRKSTLGWNSCDTRADDMRDILEMLREIEPDDSDLESSAWLGFREQNDIIMAVFAWAREHGTKVADFKVTSPMDRARARGHWMRTEHHLKGYYVEHPEMAGVVVLVTTCCDGS